jgi:glycosyltransferase involved in cell wall biosynthesis
MKLSVIIIAKNEEIMIKNCISSLKFADEIIVLDNQSYDKTVQIAEKSGATVFPVIGRDFSYLRNIAREKSSGDWLLYIDADEIVTEKLAKEIVKAISSPSENIAYKIMRKNNYLGTDWPGVEKMVRLFKKSFLLGWHGSLHETPFVSGPIGNLNNNLLHYTHRDISSMVLKTNEWSETEATLRYKNNHPMMSPLRFFSVMIKAFYRSYISDCGWKAGTVGVIESLYQTFSIFITYAKLWEKQNKRKKIK